MEEASSEIPSFIYVWRRGFVLEPARSEDHPYTLTTKEYPLPGCNLKYEHTTLTSEHRPVVSGLFRWFRSAISHCNSQNGGELVNEMVEVFRRHKDELPAPLRQFVLAHGIMEICYRLRIDDSQLVNQVLDLLHEIDRSSSSLYHLDIFTRSSSAASGGRTNSNQPDFLTFYFEHAQRLQLEYDGARFIDTNIEMNLIPEPLFLAKSRDWKPLLRYLQFGAKLENAMMNPSYIIQRVPSALTGTLRNLIIHLWLAMVEPAITLSQTDPKAIVAYCNNPCRKVRKLCRTLQYILRTVKHLRHDVVGFVIQEYRDQGVVEFSGDRIINHPIVQLMVPTLSQRFQRPIQLQHACKLAIRERLNENWQLPFGINHLPLPDRMKKYLNLLSDEI